MKLPELKEKLKNKYVVRVVAGALVIAVVGSAIGVSTVMADKNTNEQEQTQTISNEKETDDTDELTESVLDNVTENDEEVDKEESVYLISDANGNVSETIVVDHLTNKQKTDSLSDATNLANITNVNGNETFTQEREKITWKCSGNEIYYQGTTNQKPPVTQSVTYYLDGKQITPEELAGKSGKVTVRFNYTNTTTYTKLVDGETVTVSAPFAAVSAIVLDDSFTNIEVTNGKVEKNETSNIVIGYALPGLKESLGIENGDMEEDVNIPDYFEFTADVKDFSFSTAMTVVVNASDYVGSDGIDTGDLDDMLAQLSDASSKLQDGSSELADGMGELKSGIEAYLAGSELINAGLNELGGNVGTLVSGVNDLNTGAGKLYYGIQDANNGAGQLSAGLAQANTGASQLAAGMAKLNENSQTIRAYMLKGIQYELDATVNANNLVGLLSAAGLYSGGDTSVTTDNIDTFVAILTNESYAGVIKSTIDSQMGAGTYDALVGGLKKAQGGIASANDLPSNTASLAQGANQLDVGLDQLETGAANLDTGLDQLEAGSLQLQNGTQTLADKVPALTNGINQLVTGSNTLVSNDAQLREGASKLDSGANELADGIVQFNEEGINIILGSYKGDLKGLANRLSAVIDAGEEYQVFTSLAEGQTGNVKFIYKLSGVNAEKDNK